MVILIVTIIDHISFEEHRSFSGTDNSDSSFGKPLCASYVADIVVCAVQKPMISEN